MNRRKIGQILFWFGVICIIIWQALTWFQSPIHRTHTAEELSETIHAVWGILFWIRIMGGSGLAFTFVGVLLYTGEKGSYFWLLGFLPSFSNFGQYWQPEGRLSSTVIWDKNKHFLIILPIFGTFVRNNLKNE